MVPGENEFDTSVIKDLCYKGFSYTIKNPSCPKRGYGLSGLSSVLEDLS